MILLPLIIFIALVVLINLLSENKTSPSFCPGGQSASFNYNNKQKLCKCKHSFVSHNNNGHCSGFLHESNGPWIQCNCVEFEQMYITAKQLD